MVIILFLYLWLLVRMQRMIYLFGKRMNLLLFVKALPCGSRIFRSLGDGVCFYLLEITIVFAFRLKLSNDRTLYAFFNSETILSVE